MKNGRCVIFAAGDFFGNFEKSENDFIIAADAGFHHLKKIGIQPDVLLGDFDTIGEMPEHNCVITYPCEKDCTDTELALMEGIKRGYHEFLILGAVGGKRLEHTIANLSLGASYAVKGYDITMSDGENVIKTLHDGTFYFSGEEKGFVSIFTLTGTAKGVNITGLKYPLENAVLDTSNPTLCISNEFTGKEAIISVDEGTLIIMWKKSTI